VQSPLTVSVKTTVPAKSSGRLLDALTDSIRPFTERQGLKADQIRLQREEVLIKIAERAIERLRLENARIKPIPSKGLVPLLEKASLERIGDKTMIQLWANLLASAAVGDQSNLPRYVMILSEINGRQARLLQRIMFRGDGSYVRSAEHLLDNLWPADQASVLQQLRQEPTSDPSDLRAAVDRIFIAVSKHLDIDGIALDVVSVGMGTDQWDLSVTERKGHSRVNFDRHAVDLDILASLNLLRDMTFKNLEFQRFEISAFYYVVTPLAVDMFAACNPHLMAGRVSGATRRRSSTRSQRQIQ
jgi:hypothetical protein